MNRLWLSFCEPRIKTYQVSADNLASVNVEAHHVSGAEQGKVSADRVHPDEVVKLGIPHADVAGDTLCEIDASPVAEDGCHVQRNVLAMLIVSTEGGDT